MAEHRTQKDEPPSELDDWIAVIDRIPYIGSVKRDLTALRRMLYDRRAPRVAALGPKGSGRTMLANALLGAQTFGPLGVAPNPVEGDWVSIDADGRRLEWLELPAEGEVHGLMELARRAFDEALPDLIVAVVQADATDEERATLVAAVKTLNNHLEAEHHQKTSVVVAITKCDRVPPAIDAPERKRPAIDAVGEATRTAMGGLGLKPGAFVPVVAWTGRHEQASARWNVAALAEAILTRVPRAAQLEAARAFEIGKDARREVGRALVNSASALAVTVGIAPVPFADAFVLIPLQIAMVTGIAYLSGRPWSRKAATEWIASLGVVGGAGIGLRFGARQLAKLVPGAGSIIGASVAGAGTLAMGRSALAYFIDGPGSLGPRLELRADNPRDD